MIDEQTEFSESESITAPTSAPPTSTIELGCGCVFEADSPPYAIRQCAPCAAKSVEVERELEMRLGYELDVLIGVACQGRKLERIRPVDHTKR